MLLKHYSTGRTSEIIQSPNRFSILKRLGNSLYEAGYALTDALLDVRSELEILCE